MIMNKRGLIILWQIITAAVCAALIIWGTIAAGGSNPSL